MDMGAVMLMGQAADLNVELLSEVLPAVETAILTAIEGEGAAEE